MSNILILGSTGKLGSILINYCSKNNIKISTVTCYKKNKLISQQSKKHNIKYHFTLSNDIEYNNFIKHIKNTKFSLIYFLDFGSNSLVYLNFLLKNNRNSIICIANKEMIIAGGDLLIHLIKKSKNFFLPLDSEHFSLSKSNFNNKNINKIFLTASGGPFYFKKNVQISNVNLNQVLNHPKWKMGINNSVDSSNFINKILELFELSSIFSINIKKVNFLVSKSAFIHSIVLYKNSLININAFDNNMLIPMTSPLVELYESKPIKYKFNKIFDIKNLKLEVYKDNRFTIVKHIYYLKKLGHSGRINFLLLNNLAQSLYLNKTLRYEKIPAFIIKKLKKEENNIIFKSIDEILKYINKIKFKYEIHN